MRPDPAAISRRSDLIPAKAGIRGAPARSVDSHGDAIYGVHTLLRFADPGVLIWEDRCPDWAMSALQLAPWVVVRRAAPRPGLWPVGVRGGQRLERCGAWLPHEAVRDSATPQQLVAARAWRLRPGIGATPAIAALDAAEAILHARGFEHRWGPGGSAGYELASGLPCTTPHSDLDLVLYAPQALAREQAADLQRALSQLPVRIDALLETPNGAVALAEYARAGDRLLLRGATGPRLVCDPWRDESSSATVSPGA